MDIRIGFGIDVHRLVPNRKLVLGGVEIDSELGALGHSDADVLTHSIIDGILGALNLGDIGTHFPDNDPQFKDIYSIQLLRNTVTLMQSKGYKVSNLDATIVLESPKLAPYFQVIRKKISDCIGTDESRISLKAKTNEKLGHLGNHEGIQSYCAVLLINQN